MSLVDREFTIEIHINVIRFDETGNGFKYKKHTYTFHKDVVWDVQAHQLEDPAPDQLFFSASADGTVGVWKVLSTGSIC